MSRHTAVIYVEFESQPGGPASEAIADEIARDIDAFLDTDSAYAPVTSHLADVLDEAVQTSSTACVTEGVTVDEAAANTREAIALTLEDLAAREEPLPPTLVAFAWNTCRFPSPRSPIE